MPQAYPGGSVIYEGLQILKFLGFQKVVLVGVDMNFKRHTTARNIGVEGGIDIESQHDDDPNHFDPRYFGKGRRYHQPEKHVVDNILHFLSYAQAHAVDDTFTIFNAGLESRVASFPKVDFLETLGLNACEVQKRFEALLTEKTGYSLREFESEYPFFESKKEVDSHTEVESFIVSIDVGVELIKDKIEDYLPLGPFDKKYYFARRNEPND